MKLAIEENVGSSRTDSRTGKKISAKAVKRLQHLFKEEFEQVRGVDTAPGLEGTLETFNRGVDEAVARGHDYPTAVTLTAFGLSAVEAQVGDATTMSGGVRLQLILQAGNWCL